MRPQAHHPFGIRVLTDGTYASAGVDIDAKARALASLRARIRATHGPQVLGDVGHFGGLYALPGAGDNVLVASIDGVGTKLKLALALGTADAHAGIGRDLVHHSVNDILCCGARPHFFLDYLALGRSNAELIAAVVGGVADACTALGVALIGGETAELPGIYREGDYDLAGCIVGSVARGRVLDGRAMRPGDVLLGLPSTGLHTNGYSLARAVFALDGPPDAVREALAQPLSGTRATLGAALLAEHRCYLPDLTAALDAGLLHALAHITGGGLVDNVPRVLPAGCAARFDPALWSVPPVFAAIEERGHVAPMEMYRVFNMGLGMVAVVSPEAVARVRSLIPQAVLVGEIIPRGDGPAVRIAGVTEGD